MNSTHPHLPLGMIEWDSIAQGLLAADALLKEADVEVLVMRPVSPGRFVALFEGEVEAVRAAVLRGQEVGGGAVVDSLFLPAPHPSLGKALGGGGIPLSSPRDAVGVLETLSLCSLLLAADGAAKEALIDLIEIRLGMGLGGKAFVTLCGEVSQVEAALVRGTQLAEARGHHLSTALIPRPDESIWAYLKQPSEPFSDFNRFKP